MKTTAKVLGMHCTACSINIKNTIIKEKGVNNIDVNYSNEKAEIEFDPQTTSIEKLSKIIKPMGYSLVELNENTLEEIKLKKLNELKLLRKKVLFVFPFSILIFVLMIWQNLAAVFSFIPNLPIEMMFINYISFLISLFVLAITGKTFVKALVTFITKHNANMVTLIAIGTFTAFIYSTLILFVPGVSKFLNQNETYFDVVIVVIGFILFGKYLEDKSKTKTGEAVEKLLKLQAKKAILLTKTGEIEINTSEIKLNDTLLIKPGSTISTDGKIIEGFSSIDESMISGESIPVDKNIGDLVIGGTINKQGFLKISVTKTVNENTLTKIIKLVENAQSSKSQMQKTADKVSSIFVPSVLVISLITLMLWVVLGAGYLGFEKALSLGIVNFVGVLVIACPCALGLATPTAIIVGMGEGAKRGILIKNAESLEKLKHIQTVAFDKTGTITKGEPEVTSFITTKNIKKEELINIVYSLEKMSEHPLSKAVTHFAKHNKAKLLSVKNFSVVEGKGIKGEIKSKNYFIGNKKYILEIIKNIESDLENNINQTNTPIIIADEKSILGIVLIKDTLKDNAKKSIEELTDKNIDTVMITGDTRQVAENIAKEVGIKNIYSHVLPEQKLKIVEELQKQKFTAFVGDGINDSPALAKSDVGISLSTASDIAIEAADVILLNGDISKVVKAYNLSVQTIKTIKQNLFFAFIYNVIGIPVAAGILYPFFGITLNPVFAGMAMAFSSISVVSNSLRLKTKNI